MWFSKAFRKLGHVRLRASASNSKTFIVLLVSIQNSASMPDEPSFCFLKTIRPRKHGALESLPGLIKVAGYVCSFSFNLYFETVYNQKKLQFFLCLEAKRTLLHDE